MPNPRPLFKAPARVYRAVIKALKRGGQGSPPLSHEEAVKKARKIWLEQLRSKDPGIRRIPKLPKKYLPEVEKAFKGELSEKEMVLLMERIPAKYKLYRGDDIKHIPKFDPKHSSSHFEGHYETPNIPALNFFSRQRSAAQYMEGGELVEGLANPHARILEAPWEITPKQAVDIQKGKYDFIDDMFSVKSSIRPKQVLIKQGGKAKLFGVGGASAATLEALRKKGKITPWEQYQLLEER